MRLRQSLVKRAGILVMALGSTLVGARASATHPLRVESGVLTVDGLTVETGVNLHIANMRYLYVSLPGSGTAVIAEQPFAGAREQKAAFRGNALTVSAGGSRLQLTAANRMRGTHAAFVRFEPGAGPAGQRPAVSYGDSALVSAIWQGDEMAHPRRRQVKVSARRQLRTARLCRPSRHGREMCATIREVVYRH